MNEKDYENLGMRIREQRNRAKLTQIQLAERANISYPFLGHIERGTRIPSLDTLVSICNALDVSPNLLLRDSLKGDLLGSDMPPRRRKFLREISDIMDEYENSIPRD